MRDEKIERSTGIEKDLNHQLDKRNDIMKKTQFIVEDIFGDILGEEGISNEQKPIKNFFSENDLKINFSINTNLNRPRKAKIIDRALLLNNQISSKQIDQKQTYCVGGRHKSTTVDIIEYEKRYPKTNKIVKIKKGKCDICGRSK